MKDYAYFCARCASVKTDASNAERLATSLGLELWKPSDKVSFTFPEGAQECRDAIDGAAVVICQPPIGNDCSWELGYAVGTGRKIYVLGNLEPDDWMTKIGVSCVQLPGAPRFPGASQRQPAPAESAWPKRDAQIHPFEKSLPNYVRIGFEYAAGAPIPDEALTGLFDLSLLDTSVLVIDDILDGSRSRAGRPSLHRDRGVNSAIVEAMLMASESVEAFGAVADAVGTPVPYRLRIHELVNRYLSDMYHGQRLDLEARLDADDGEATMQRYTEIISLITASHVRFGLECGQSLAGARPDPQISRAAEALGRMRQMLDDFHDYFDDHHEPFGDFKNALNRLPEILFKRAGGSRDTVMRALAAGRTEEARDLVLTAATREAIHSRCAAELAVVTQARPTLDLTPLAEDIRPVLSRRYLFARSERS